jgi:hypothetical protein
MRDEQFEIVDLPRPSLKIPQPNFWPHCFTYRRLRYEFIVRLGDWGRLDILSKYKKLDHY